MPTSSISVQVDDIACIIPETQLRDYLLKSGITKVNDFEVRPGFDFCEGHFILTSSDVDSLDPQNVSITYRETRTDPQPDVEVKFDNLIIAETSLLLTPVEESNTLLLVKIVDQRYYSVKNLVGISHSLFPSTSGRVHADAKETWQEIFDDYWANTSNSLPLSHGKAVYPTSVMRDVHFNEPISSLRVMTRVLSMLSHSIYVTRTGGSTGYEIAPLFLQAGTNTTLLELSDSIAREIQKKNDNNVDEVRRPNEHTVVFRNNGIDTSENSITIPDPNPISNFSRTTSIFSQRDDAAADQIFADDISSLMFSSYETFNLNNRVYFGLMDFQHSADCSIIHFYFDILSNSFKTKIKSHSVQSSFQAESDFNGVSSVELVRCSDGLRAFADNVAVGTQRLADFSGQVVNVAASALLRSECWTVVGPSDCSPEICPTVLGVVADCDSCVPTCFNLTLCTDTTFVRKIMQPAEVFLQDGDVVALFDELCYMVSIANDCVDAEIIELSQSQVFDDCSSCGPACFDLTPCPGETADVIVARSGVSQIETEDTSEDDTIEFDFDFAVGKVVRLEDGICYIVSVHVGDCSAGVDDVVVLEMYNDCSTCLVYTLDSCTTSDRITTYSDLSEYGVGTIIMRAEDETCYEIFDNTAVFSDTTVEVMVEESFINCDNCTDPIFKLEPTCPSCEEANPGVECEAEAGATQIAGSGQTEYTDEDLIDHLERYVKIDGVCYFVERDPDRHDTTLPELEITSSFEDCQTCQKQCLFMVVDVIDGTGAIQQRRIRTIVDMVCDEMTSNIVEVTEDCPQETL